MQLEREAAADASHSGATLGSDSSHNRSLSAWGDEVVLRRVGQDCCSPRWSGGGVDGAHLDRVERHVCCLDGVAETVDADGAASGSDGGR